MLHEHLIYNALRASKIIASTRSLCQVNYKSVFCNIWQVNNGNYPHYRLRFVMISEHKTLEES
jgi:hypothetical protein